MSEIEQYKKLIIERVKNSEDLNYVIALYSFADAYPDNTPKEGE